MPYLALLRHGQSQWNLENRFTGWEDVDLSPLGEQEARRAGILLKEIPFDRVYTSALRRAQRTAQLALEASERTSLVPISDPALNERHYGDLQGLNKTETAAKYGAEQVHIWRRSFDVCPPGPKAESLAKTIERVLPYVKLHIIPDLKAGLNVLVVAHGNSLRALLYELEKHTAESIMGVEIPTGVPILFKLHVEEDGTLTIESKHELNDVASPTADAVSPA